MTQFSGMYVVAISPLLSCVYNPAQLQHCVTGTVPMPTQDLLVTVPGTMQQHQQGD